MELRPVDLRDTGEIERTFTAFAMTYTRCRTMFGLRLSGFAPRADQIYIT